MALQKTLNQCDGGKRQFIVAFTFLWGEKVLLAF